MSKARSEWLILPFLALPVLAGLAMAPLAKSRYEAGLEPFRADGEAMARTWFDELPDGGSGLRTSFLAGTRPAEPGTPVSHTAFDAHVEGVELGERWFFVDTFPTGLAATSLADSSVRMQIQSGSASTVAGSVDDATREFGELLERRDIERLRLARLPASSKAYVVRRWLRASPDDAALLDVRTLLTRVVAAERVAEHADLSRAIGVIESDGLDVICLGPDEPLRIVDPADQAVQVDTTYTLASTKYPDVQLHWGTPPKDRELTWSGVLATPLAGTWHVVLPHGDRWWDGSEFVKWRFPVGLGLGIVIAAGALLWVSLRKQRLLGEARARFINELAHDLRTPLSSLRLHAEMLASGRVGDDAHGRYVGVIERESGRLSSLLANILDLSRLEAGRRTFEMGELDVAEIVEFAVGDFASLRPDRADDVSVEGPNDVSVRADRPALARCLANLLDNAGKFTEPGTAIRVTWTRGDGGVQLVVADDGPGVRASERERVFRRYERGAHAEADGIAGTGLGLSLVRELADGMGGSVTLLPTKQGAAFELRLEEGGSDA